ncbi:MAG TPA: hypothetical protein VIO32_00325, partial [Candidatus Baltobacteraceae bacterium]
MVLSLIFAAAAALSNSDVFMQRLADSDFPQIHKTVTVGALPPGWTPPAPLPQGVPLLGAVYTANADTELYYAPTDANAASQQYVTQLRAAGYREHLGVAGRGGFSFAQIFGNLTVMCKGDRGVSIRIPQPDDLRVDFAAPTAIGACVPQQPRFTTPVPDLLAPAGTQMTSAGAGGGMTYAVGSGSSLFSSARFKTPLSAKQLLAAFTAQMRAAKWSALPPFASPQGAAQQFIYDNGAQHWSSTLVIFRERAAHTYEGNLEASGTPQVDTQVSTSPPMAVVRTLSVSKIPRALALAQRIAGAFASGGGSAQLVVGALPPAFDRRIPLPSGSLVGSVSSDTQASVFYDLTRAQFDAYVS